MKSLTILISFMNNLRFGMPMLGCLKYMTSEDVEWLVIDNGSTDPIESYIRNYIKPKRLNFIRYEENQGLINNIQEAYTLCETDLLMFLHNDCFIYEKDWDLRVRRYFEEIPDLGMAGFFGAQGCMPNGGRIQDVEFPGQMSGLSNMLEAEIHGIKLKTSWRSCAIYDSFCFDEKTEILTNNGWKFFRNLKGEDLVFTFNKEKEISRWSKINQIIRNKYKGEMYSFKSNSIDLLVTPNHRLFGKNRRGKYKFILAKDLGIKTLIIPNIVNWQGKEEKYFYLPEYKNKNNYLCKKMKIEMDIWIAFMALYLSEGSLGRRTKKKGADYQYINIAQSNNNKKNIIKFNKLLNKLPWKWSRYQYEFRTQSVQLCHYLLQFGHSKKKYIPRYIKELSERQINIFLEYYLDGDGTRQKSGREIIFTSSPQMAEDLQELIIKSGKLSRIWHWRDGIRLDVRRLYSRGFHYECTKKEIISNYDGIVSCVNTDDGIVLVRRNNRVMWSGNSMIMSMEMLKKENGFDMRYKFHHGFDRDISLESLRRGYKNIVVDIPCHHIGGITHETPQYQAWLEKTIGNKFENGVIHNENMAMFTEKWKEVLPLYINDDFSFRTSQFQVGNEIVSYKGDAIIRKK